MGRHGRSGHRVRVVVGLDVVTGVSQVNDRGRQIRRRRELRRPGIDDDVVDPADVVAGIHIEGAVQGLHFPHAVFLHEIIFIIAVTPAAAGHDHGDAAQLGALGRRR